jgi:hypothetical protein
MVHILTSGPCSVVGIATACGLDGPWIESRWGARFSAPVQTGPEAHAMGTGSFPGVKRPGRDADRTPHSSAEVKNRVELTSTLPKGLCGLWKGDTYLHILTISVQLPLLYKSQHDSSIHHAVCWMLLSFRSNYVNLYLCIRADKLGVLKVDPDMVITMSDAMYTGSMLISGSINCTVCHVQCRRISISNFHGTVRQIQVRFKPKVLNLWVAMVFGSELQLPPTKQKALVCVRVSVSHCCTGSYSNCFIFFDELIQNNLLYVHIFVTSLTGCVSVLFEQRQEAYFTGKG